jgi:parvulin-like peptidyl-prolyl isomerase
MRCRFTPVLTCIVTALLCGCQSDETVGGWPLPDESSQQQGGSTGDARRDASPVAYVAGEPIRSDDLLPGLYEAAGGDVLAEAVLGRLIERELKDRGLAVAADDIRQERSVITGELSEDAQQAERLLDELRMRRGLGDRRFEALLRRNAGLRKLVNAQENGGAGVTVPDQAVQKAYRERYGPTYRVRLITVSALREANDLRRRAQAGEPFGELAARHSTDASADRGGLLSPINPEDATYPAAIRNSLPNLPPGSVSDVIALDGTYAILKLEEAIPASPIPYAQVEASLKQQVRRRLERLRMEQLATVLIDQQQVLVLDPTLKPQWERSRRTLTQP